MRFLHTIVTCVIPVLALGNPSLASKVIRISLNQNEPAFVRVGIRGITTLEFPAKIAALDGYGFSTSPSPDGPDLFQISYNKGTNFFSLKAMHDGAEGNLTVVLEDKVYCLFCTAVADPSFVVIFEDNSAKTISSPQDVLAKRKLASPARLLGFLDKLKAYPSLKVSAPEVFRDMAVAEPNSESSLDGLKLTLRRVLRDESLDALGFEVELANQSSRDFLFDPESLGVRIGDEVYPEALSDAGGIVQAGKTLPAFFVVAGTAAGERNDLAVTNKFDVVIRQVIEAKDSKSSTDKPESPDAVPAALRSSPEPGLPVADNDSSPPVRSFLADEQKDRKSPRRKKSRLTSEERHAAQLGSKENARSAVQRDE